MPVTFVLYDKPDYYVLNMIGDVLADGSSANLFDANIQCTLNHPNRKLVLNFDPELKKDGPVRFDFSGLAILVNLLMKDKGTGVHICHYSNPDIEHLRKVNGLDNYSRFGFYNTLDNALDERLKKLKIFA